LCFRPVPQQFLNVSSGDASLTVYLLLRDDHVILSSTFEFLFEFRNRIFLEFFVRV
jgi:hypothetical protein